MVRHSGSGAKKCSSSFAFARMPLQSADGRPWPINKSLRRDDLLHPALFRASACGTGVSRALHKRSQIDGEIFDIVRLDIFVAHETTAHARVSTFAAAGHIIPKHWLSGGEHGARDLDDRLSSTGKTSEVTSASAALFVMIDIILEGEHLCPARD